MNLAALYGRLASIWLAAISASINSSFSSRVSGGLNDWHIDDDILQLILEPEAAQTLGLPTALRLPLPPTEMSLVREHLPALLGR